MTIAEAKKELWKDVQGYEGSYQVSSFGRVRSLDRIDFVGRQLKGAIMKPNIMKSGYHLVGLRRGNIQNKLYIHRLVALAFIDNPYNLLEINHLDEDKSNNNHTNLEWCSRKYNMNYGTGAKRGGINSSKEVYQYSLDNKLIRKYKSATEASKQTGFNLGNICSCCRGDLKTSKGFVWKYKEVK